MNRTRLLTVVTTALALIAPASVVALATSAEAGSAKRHSVNMYKVEGWVEVLGEYPDNEAHEHLFCEPGDVVVDGMWKLDSYDTPNADDGTFGDTRDVIATESWGDLADDTKWHFYFVNNGTGRATLKTFITCLTPETGTRNGHTHDIFVTDQAVEPVLGFGSGTVTRNFSTDCPAGQFAVAPGFETTAGSARLVDSMPSANARGWTWTFDVLTASADISFYLKCLNNTVSSEVGTGDDPGKPHVHYLDLSWSPSTALELFTVGSSPREIATQKASPKDFALVGGFDTVDPTDTYYLGQDARGRKRDFVFWCTDLVSCDVRLGVLSIDKRTSWQKKP